MSVTSPGFSFLLNKSGGPGSRRWWHPIWWSPIICALSRERFVHPGPLSCDCQHLKGDGGYALPPCQVWPCDQFGQWDTSGYNTVLSRNFESTYVVQFRLLYFCPLLWERQSLGSWKNKNLGTELSRAAADPTTTEIPWIKIAEDHQYGDERPACRLRGSQTGNDTRMRKAPG